LPPEKRPCFKCGKPGCRPVKCAPRDPRASYGGQNGGPRPNSRGINFFGCLEYASKKPEPKEFKLGDAITKAFNLKNKYKALEEDDPDEETNEIKSVSVQNSKINEILALILFQFRSVQQGVVTEIGQTARNRLKQRRRWLTALAKGSWRTARLSPMM